MELLHNKGEVSIARKGKVRVDWPLTPGAMRSTKVMYIESFASSIWKGGLPKYVEGAATDT